MSVTEEMSKAARQFDAVVKGDLRDVLDDLKRYMIDAVSDAYDQGRLDERASRPKGRTVKDRQLSADIRAWAQASGRPVARLGRLPDKVRKAYERDAQ